MPARVDDVRDGVEAAYTRLYVIDNTGRGVYKNMPSRFGFKPKAIEDSLLRAIAEI
jgi:hypothetical protein